MSFLYFFSNFQKYNGCSGITIDNDQLWSIEFLTHGNVFTHKRKVRTRRDGHCLLFLEHGFLHDFKDVRGWQFLTMEAAETLYMVCLPPEEHIFRKKYLGNRPFKKSHFVRV